MKPFVKFWKSVLWGTILLNYFEFRPVLQEEMSFNGISYLVFWQPLCSMEYNHLYSFGRVHHEEHFCEIILNLDQWFRRRCHLKTFIEISGGPFVQRTGTIWFIAVEGIMRNKSVKLFWIWSSGRLKVFLIWSSSSPFVQRSKPSVQFW